MKTETYMPNYRLCDLKPKRVVQQSIEDLDFEKTSSEKRQTWYWLTLTVVALSALTLGVSIGSLIVMAFGPIPYLPVQP